jgi:glycosyltransferase involved in cell wall biosynthesis
MVECKSLHSSRLLHLEGVSPQELDEAYLKCDIFLFPSLGEGFGIPVIEAAAHGIPCVVSDGSALSELNNYYAGRAFDSDSYADFLASIKHVIEYLEDYKARARKNIKKVVDHFSWNTTAQQFLKSILEYEK